MNASNTTVVRPRVAEYVALTKPGIVISNLLTAACGLALAADVVSAPAAVELLVGTALLVAGCRALNTLLEHGTDRLMDRPP